jgi:phosphatidylinositol alpha-mannosyltransferase
VQYHVRDLAEILLARGHQVSVLAPADEDADLPGLSGRAGRAVPVRYNGSVARLNFGPGDRGEGDGAGWTGGEFDVIHIHEP